MLHQVQYGGIYVFVRMLSWLPGRLLSLLGGALAHIALWAAKKDREKLYRNLRNIYKINSHSIFARNFALQVFRHQIMVGLESLVCGVSARCRRKLKVEGYDQLHSAVQGLKAQKNGIIVITAHLGNWELVAKYAGDAMGETFYALAKPSKSAALTTFLEYTRKAMGTKVLWTDRKSILRDMMSTLKSGHILGFVMDQKPEGRKGPVVDFFGQPTEFVSGPAKLALRTKAPVLGIFCMREGPWQYRLIVNEITVDPNLAAGELVLTQAMATQIEKMIRLYPEQWVWNYKRWRFKK